MNNVNLIGRLTRDPELKHTNTNNVPVCSFTIAVKSYGDKDDYFFNCVAWKKQAENLVQYQRKGNMIGVSGELQSRKYEKDGQNRTAVEVNAFQIDFLDPKQDRNEKDTKKTPQDFESDATNYDDGSGGQLPF